MADLDEIDAMKKIAAALEPLDDGARARALQWAFSRYRAKATSNEGAQLPTAHAGLDFGRDGVGQSQFEAFAELFSAANPHTESDKALVASYWVQVCDGADSFSAQTLNDLLKDLGHGVGNITEALNQLKEARPALALQLKKSGTSKQARKTYKLTQEGTKRVRSMFESPVNEA